MGAAMKDGDLQAALHQVLGNLKADEAAADDDCGFRLLLLDEVGDGERVLDGAQREDALVVGAGNVGLDCLGAGGKDELVVALVVFLAGFEVLHVNFLGIAVDCRDLGLHANVDVEALLEALGRLYGELLALFDDAADVVRFAAVGIRDVAGALEDDDLGVLVVAAQTCCCAGTAGNATDDYNFHSFSFECIECGST